MSSYILSYTCSSVICGTFYVCPKRTYSCIKRTRRQQVNLRERIPNAMFVTLSTYFYVGARMLYFSRRDVVYTNADERRFNVCYQEKSNLFCGLRIDSPTAKHSLIFSLNSALIIKTIYDRRANNPTHRA